MPRIRKKSSKRGTTHQRAKIKHKIAEGRRKKKKEAKKNPQWKSKKNKDPGIPNEFPYKDQILAEVAESRRQAEEAKRKHKEEKKAAQGHATGSDDDVENAPPVESSSSKRPRDDGTPLLLSPDLPNLKAVLDKADIVLHVLDARDPASFRLHHIEEAVSTNEHPKLVFVLNKIDLVPREALGAWAKHLRSQHPTFLFRAASAFLPKSPVNHRTAKGKAKEESCTDALGASALLEFFRRRAEETQNGILQVAVVGITNTGKSAIINSLARKAVVPTYAPTPSMDTWSTTTPRAYEVTLESTTITNKRVNLIDTPGVSLHNDPEQPFANAATLRIRDILRRSRGRVDKLKDPVPAIEYILSRANTTDLMLHYSLPAFSSGDTTAFLAGVARANALLKKGGVPDAAQAAKTVLRDWMAGRLPFYTEAEQEGEAAPEDVGVLEMVGTRKEMRRGAPGLVRLELPTEKEMRRVELERMFTGDEKTNGGESEDADEGMDEGKDEDEDEDEDEDDGVYAEDGADKASDQDGDGSIHEGDDKDDDAGGDDADILTPAHGKRKRAVAATKTAPPTKKVVFAAGTQDHRERERERTNGKLKSTGRSQTQATKSSKTATKSSRAATKRKKDPAKPPKSDAVSLPKSSTKPPASVKKSPLTKGSIAQDNTVEGNAYDFGQFFK